MIPRVVWSRCRLLARCFQKLSFRVSVKFFVLSFLSLLLYVFTMEMHVSWKSIPNCNPSHTTLTLFQQNGKVHPEEFQFFDGMTDNEQMRMMAALREKVQAVASQCKSSNNVDCFQKGPRLPLLTLFTTWHFDPAKFRLNNNTLYNWRTFPQISVIVFTNSSKVSETSKKAGCMVLPIQREVAGGVAELPAMFLAAKSASNSLFYGYANADLLFEEGLVKTLEKVWCEIVNSSEFSPLLIVGRRVNIMDEDVDDDLSWAKIRELALSLGQRFVADAEDYFITNALFPWEKFAPVAVGRRAYDNWVVAVSRYWNFTVIDATDSILALHQTVKERGNYEGLFKPFNNYNIEIIEKHNVPFVYEQWGKTYCTPWRTWYELCGKVVISKRNNFHENCFKLKSWSFF